MLLPLHVGMRVRLTEKLSPHDQLVQEAEGLVLHIVFDRDEPAPMGMEIVTKYSLRGVWVRFDKCSTSPLRERVKARLSAGFEQTHWGDVARGLGGKVDEESPGEFSSGVVWVPAVTRSFKKEIGGKTWHVVRRQVPLTSALDRTYARGYACNCLLVV